MLFVGDGDSRRREGSNSGCGDENDDGYDDRGGGRDRRRKARGAGMDTGGRGREERMNGSTGKAGSKQERTRRRGQEGPEAGSKAGRLVEERCALLLTQKCLRKSILR